MKCPCPTENTETTYQLNEVYESCFIYFQCQKSIFICVSYNAFTYVYSFLSSVPVVLYLLLNISLVLARVKCTLL